MNSIFYNSRENRLRAGWRIAGTSITLFLLFNVWALFSGPALTIPGFAVIVLLVVMLSGRYVDKRPLADFGLSISGRWTGEFFLGNLIAALAMTFVAGLSYTFGWMQFTGVNGSIVYSDTTGPLLYYLIFMLAVSVWEEIFFRSYLIVNLKEGLLLRTLNEKYVTVLAVLIPALIFGIVHTINPYSSWFSFLNIMIAGIIFAIPFIITKRLGLSVGMHLSWNYFQGVVYGFPVSGLELESSLFETQISGPELLTGGYFGPEAGVIGLAGLLMLAAQCYFILAVFYKK